MCMAEPIDSIIHAEFGIFANSVLGSPKQADADGFVKDRGALLLAYGRIHFDLDSSL